MNLLYLALEIFAIYGLPPLVLAFLTVIMRPKNDDDTVTHLKVEGNTITPVTNFSNRVKLWFMLYAALYWGGWYVLHTNGIVKFV